MKFRDSARSKTSEKRKYKQVNIHGSLPCVARIRTRTEGLNRLY